MEIIEPISGAVVATGWAGRKLLGPLFDEIADDWRQRYSEYRVRNVNRIGRNAEAKLGTRIETDGSVPPRVTLRVMDEGSWCDAPVMTEYFGGILAASRSEDGADDRGAAWSGLVSRLSTFDIYLHYLAYEAFRRLYIGRSDLPLGIQSTRDRCEVFMPLKGVLLAMGVEVSVACWLRYVVPSMNALVREGLLGQVHAYGSMDFLREHKRIDPPDDGLAFTPSVAGIELFMWAHGNGDHDVEGFLDEDVAYTAQEDLGSVASVETVEAMARTRSVSNEANV